MPEEIVTQIIADRFFQITLNRPRQFNALTNKMFLELSQAIRDFENSPCRVLMLTGSGRAFCFGADFQEFQDQTKLPSLLSTFQNLILQLFRTSKPTIALLNGFATGAGLDLALACDFRIASERAKLGEAYIKMGLVSDGGGSYFLNRLIGPSRAMELLVTGEAISAEKALEWGLVHRVFADSEMQKRVMEFAEKIAQESQTALSLMKKLVHENAVVSLEQALENERQAQILCFNDPEHRQKVEEFLKKRR